MGRKVMARSTREQARATADAILASAHELFSCRSYSSVSLEDIAGAAGVTRGALYHHFGSREGLFSRVHDDVQAAIAAAIDAATLDIDDPVEGLRVGSRVFLAASVSTDARQVLLLDAPSVLGWDRWRDSDAANSGRQLLSVLVELKAAGRLRSGEPEATSALLSGGMNELALWVAHSDDVPAALDRAQIALSSLVDGVIE